ncbi:MAG: TolC family protein [candidate division Zixibacteria bacterium]|nr:TolC family protein [candidate division Zixibacteria bacterium]
MRLRNAVITLLIISVLSGGAVVSAETLTLDQCIEHALKTRANVIIARGRESLAAKDKLRAIGNFLPNIDGSYSYTKGEQTNIDPALFNPITGDTSDAQDFGPDRSLTLSAGATFSFSNVFNYLGARASHGAAHLAAIDTEQELIYQVKTTYYNYLRAVQSEEVNRQAVERSKEQLKLVESRYELGSAAYSDVLRQRVQYGTDRLELLKAQNNMATTKAVLSYTAGLDPNKDMEFSTVDDMREYEGTLEQAIGFGITHEPGYLSSLKDYSASRYGVKTALAEYLPRITGFARYTDFEGTQAFPVVFDYSFNSITYGFQINYSIFDGFGKQREIGRSKISRNNAGAALSDTRNRVVQQIKIAYADIQNQKEGLLVAEETVAAAEEDMKIVRERYNLGAATILDLLKAQENLKGAQVSFINTRFSLNLSIANLENSMGKP